MKLPIIEALTRKSKAGCLPDYWGQQKEINGLSPKEFSLHARVNFVRADVKQLEKTVEGNWEVFTDVLKMMVSPKYKHLKVTLSTAHSQIILFGSTSLRYNIGEVPQDLNSSLYQLTYGKKWFVIRRSTSSRRTHHTLVFDMETQEVPFGLENEYPPTKRRCNFLPW